MSRLVAVLVIVLSLSTAAYGGATITLQGSSSVKASEMVTLGQMANITGEKSEVERLKQVEIARAALPGSSRQVTPDWIKARLACAGFDAKSVTMKSPTVVILSSASQTVKGADVIDAAKKYITSQLSQSDLTYTVTETGSQSDILAPTGKLELVCESNGRTVTAGKQVVCVEVLVDGSPYTKKNVGVDAKASGLVLVATQPIKAKEALTAANTRLDQRDIANVASGYLTSVPDDGVKIAGRPIAPGAVISPDMISEKPAVVKGEPVIVMVKSGAVKVVVKGTANQDGVVGDSIRVSIPTTNEFIQAVVSKPGLVEVRI